MVEWLAGLDPEQQQFLVGLAAMVLIGVVRACFHWAGKPLSDTSAAKLKTLFMVALTTGVGTVLTTPLGAGFVWAWAVAFVASVGSWEGLSKLYKSLKYDGEPL